MIDLIIFTTVLATWVTSFRVFRRDRLRATYWRGLPLSLDELEQQRCAQRCNCEECE